MKHIFALALALAMTGTAHAKDLNMVMPCYPDKAITGLLTDKYHESPNGFGISGFGDLIRVYVSERKTWTIILTKPDGMSCIFIGGKDWENVKPEIEGKKT